MTRLEQELALAHAQLGSGRPRRAAAGPRRPRRPSGSSATRSGRSAIPYRWGGNHGFSLEQMARCEPDLGNGFDCSSLHRLVVRARARASTSGTGPAPSGSSARLLPARRAGTGPAQGGAAPPGGYLPGDLIFFNTPTTSPSTSATTCSCTPRAPATSCGSRGSRPTAGVGLGPLQPGERHRRRGRTEGGCSRSSPIPPAGPTCPRTKGSSSSAGSAQGYGRDQRRRREAHVGERSAADESLERGDAARAELRAGLARAARSAVASAGRPAR